MNENILDAEFDRIKGKPVGLLQLILSIILMGIIIGGTTNLINGNLSEEYYRQTLGWNFNGIWKAAILQGIVEGAVYGTIYSIIFNWV